MSEREVEPGWASVWEWIGIRTEGEQRSLFARLVTVCRNMLARRGCHRVDAGEVASEVFFRLAKRGSGEGPPRDVPPFAFVCGVARNVVREMCRAGAREVPLLDEDVVHMNAVPPPAGPTMECHRRCLDGLQLDHRELVMEYADADAPERKQIAERLGIDMNLLRVRINKIRARLNSCKDDCLAGRGVTI